MKQIILAAAAILIFAAPALAGGDGYCDYSAKARVAYKGKAKVKIKIEAKAKETAKDQARKIIASSHK
jgi:hypothetical protein